MVTMSVGLNHTPSGAARNRNTTCAGLAGLRLRYESSVSGNCSSGDPPERVRSGLQDRRRTVKSGAVNANSRRRKAPAISCGFAQIDGGLFAGIEGA